MASTSSSIDSIVQCLAKASEAAKGLDARSQNLCFVLNIACNEANRVAKAMNKNRGTEKSAKETQKAAKEAKEAKKPAKNARNATPAKQPKSQGRNARMAANGALPH
jgi:hypothetical protein